MNDPVERAKLPKLLVEDEKISPDKLKKLKDEQAKRAHDTGSGAYVAHVYQVFTDPDFEVDVQNLRVEMEQLYYKNIDLRVDRYSEHILEDDIIKLKSVADKYCITIDDLGNFAVGLFNTDSRFGANRNEFGGLELMRHPGHWGVCYVIGEKTTLEQITSEWEYIKGMRSAFTGKESTKNKSPQSPDLIYAIFKARNKYKLKYSEIFKLYEAGQLEGYKGKSTKQFASEDSLERYYRKYMPTKQFGDFGRAHL